MRHGGQFLRQLAVCFHGVAMVQDDLCCRNGLLADDPSQDPAPWVTESSGTLITLFVPVVLEGLEAMPRPGQACGLIRSRLGPMGEVAKAEMMRLKG